MPRAEFSKATKLAAFERANGRCEECGAKLFSAEYDHIVEAYLSQDNSLENCKCLCVKCHALKTKERRPEIDKTRAIYEKRAGLRKTKRPFPKRVDAWNKGRE